MPVTDMGEMVGSIGFFVDSEGNRIGVHKPPAGLTVTAAPRAAGSAGRRVTKRPPPPAAVRSVRRPRGTDR